ncbi:MAG: hypothetical protein GW855_09440 [Erythrobacter sp.]|nr:hypothetical protein [Erythrobacter sp.]NCQ64778.1 hypothetical protein [Alphaproteobacteria bacterium]
MDRQPALCAAACDLIGTPFRLQGRDPATGLDCVGLVLASLRQVGVQPDLPADYRPRRRTIAIPDSALAAVGLHGATGVRRAGDILLLRTAPMQAHLAIALSGQDIVHAHAALRRVVRCPLPEDWAVLAAWRLADPQTGDPEWPR